MDICPEEYKDIFNRILINNRLILGLMSTDHLINTDKMRELCRAQQHLYNCFKDETGASWVRMTPTLHELYAHVPEFIEINGGRGLKNCSEVWYSYGKQQTDSFITLGKPRGFT